MRNFVSSYGASSCDRKGVATFAFLAVEPVSTMNPSPRVDETTPLCQLSVLVRVDDLSEAGRREPSKDRIVPYLDCARRKLYETRLERMQLEHVGKSLDELTPKVDALVGLPEKVDALRDQVQDLA